MISNRTLTRFIEQSNLIEGIDRKPTAAEIEAHKRFLALDQITIADLESFVEVVAPGKRLRSQSGMNVWVGDHTPPPGGPDVPVQHQALLDQVNRCGIDPWRAHCLFETLHPFLDGNGRSGRALWLWQHRGRQLPPLLFLHSFYYETLGNSRA